MLIKEDMKVQKVEDIQELMNSKVKKFSLGLPVEIVLILVALLRM